tara:strand:- start:795 stop:2051 length:1257 start_codon:yes stop_codon:yes gene_type:complete
MSGFYVTNAEFRRNQKALQQNLTVDGSSTWEAANEKLIKENWKETLLIRSEMEGFDPKAAALDPTFATTEENIKKLKEDVITKPKDEPNPYKINNREQGSAGTKYRGASLRYPYEALTDETDYLQIDIRDYVNVKDRSGGIYSGTSMRRNLSFNSVQGLDKRHLSTSRLKRGQGTILLPIPSNIADSNSVTFADGSLDAITGQVYNNIDQANMDFGEGGSKFSQIPETLANTLGSVANTLGNADAGFKKSLTASLAAAAANIPMGGSLTRDQIFARSDGEILNPNMELLFNGVKLRTFKFSFKLTPRDETEAEQIRLIIRAFKENMAPKIQQAESTFLETPSMFELTYKKGIDRHPFLNKFKQCALTDMSVNYTSEGVYATYEGGTPVSMILELGFKELEPIYDVDYDSWEGSEGVGY